MNKEQIESLYWKFREEMYHKTDEIRKYKKWNSRITSI